MPRLKGPGRKRVIHIVIAEIHKVSNKLTQIRYLQKQMTRCRTRYAACSCVTIRRALPAPRGAFTCPASVRAPAQGMWNLTTATRTICGQAHFRAAARILRLTLSKELGVLPGRVIPVTAKVILPFGGFRVSGCENKTFTLKLEISSV